QLNGHHFMSRVRENPVSVRIIMKRIIGHTAPAVSATQIESVLAHPGCPIDMEFMAGSRRSNAYVAVIQHDKFFIHYFRAPRYLERPDGKTVILRSLRADNRL